MCKYRNNINSLAKLAFLPYGNRKRAAGTVPYPLGDRQAFSGLSQDLFHDIIAAEFEKIRSAVLKITGQERLLDSHMAIQQSIVLRNPYTDVLNLIQVELLRRWAVPSKEQSIPLRRALFLSINSSAAAMQSTG